MFDRLSSVIEQHLTSYYPFSALTGLRVSEVTSQMRLFEMRSKESFALEISNTGRKEFMSVLQGEIKLVTRQLETNLSSGDFLYQSPQKNTVVTSRVVVHCEEDALVTLVDNDLLTYLVNWESLASEQAKGDIALHKGVLAIRNSKACANLPLASIELAFSRMKRRQVTMGQVIINEGDQGDEYYIIGSGSADVIVSKGHSRPTVVANLVAGDSFGEEALISSESRNATVEMRSDGELFVLGKSDFISLIQQSSVQQVEASDAKEYVNSDDVVTIDVRSEIDFNAASIPGSVNIPLRQFRKRIQELSTDKRYLVVSDYGNSATTAVLLMGQNMIKGAVIKGGIKSWPYRLV